MEPKRTHVLGYEGAGVAPHTETARITLSNATNRVYRVTHLMMYYERMTAPTTAGVVYMRAGLSVLGGAEQTICVLRYTGSTEYQRGAYTLPNPITLWNGDVLTIYTADSSTGGTINYWASVVYEVI